MTQERICLTHGQSPTPNSSASLIWATRKARTTRLEDAEKAASISVWWTLTGTDSLIAPSPRVSGRCHIFGGIP